MDCVEVIVYFIGFDLLIDIIGIIVVIDIVCYLCLLLIDEVILDGFVVL